MRNHPYHQRRATTQFVEPPKYKYLIKEHHWEQPYTDCLMFVSTYPEDHASLVRICAPLDASDLPYTPTAQSDSLFPFQYGR